MGISWSKSHHRYQHHHHNQHQHHHNRPPPPPLTSSSNPTPLTFSTVAPTPPQSSMPPPPTASNRPAPQPPTYAFAANAPYSAPEQYPYPAPLSCAARPPAPAPAPPPPLPPYNYSYNPSSYNARPVNVGGQYPNYRPYFFPQITGWGPSAGAVPPRPQVQPAPYVDHQSAKKIKNDVNVHKDTIGLQVDELNPDCHLVTFTFDAMVDGSITIFYFAKEGEKCKFSPVFSDIVPVKIPFQKGIGQKFCQPSGTGVDLGFFDTDELSKPGSGEDIYPLVISAESSEPSVTLDEHVGGDHANTSPHAQITQAVLEKKDGGNFKVKVVKQILWIDGARYELREIFGIGDSGEAAVNDLESGKECVICMTEEKNTAVLPCRHMCMCSDCAKELRLQSNKCPVCRQPIQELLEIKVDQEAKGST